MYKNNGVKIKFHDVCCVIELTLTDAHRNIHSIKLSTESLPMSFLTISNVRYRQRDRLRLLCSCKCGTVVCLQQNIKRYLIYAEVSQWT